MHTIALIGYGAMADYVARSVRDAGWTLSHCFIRDGREQAARARLGADVRLITSLDDMTTLPDLVVDCAGHEGLRRYGEHILARGVAMVTASIGALADPVFHAALNDAATRGGTKLTLASGAIGALDALSAAKVGGLTSVTYTGIKPPAGWRGTEAENQCDLDRLSGPHVHFEGTAGHAALTYPKNANVAAAVALAGLGFEDTTAKLVADPDATGNRHLISATGEFGTFEFSILGQSLPDTPRTSALAAMSMVHGVLRTKAPVGF